MTSINAKSMHSFQSTALNPSLSARAPAPPAAALARLPALDLLAWGSQAPSPTVFGNAPYGGNAADASTVADTIISLLNPN